MRFGKKEAPVPPPRYPGVATVLDGTGAVRAVEMVACGPAIDHTTGAGTAASEGWAAGVTAGLAMVGLRAGSFARSQTLAAMHEALYAVAGKRLPYVLNVACHAAARQALSRHAGHDDYHAVDDTGVFQLLAKNVQEAADLTLIAHRIAELALTAGIAAQDAGLSSETLESLRLPEPALVHAFLGDPADVIASPTPAQRLVFGERRRRIPEAIDVDYPTALGIAQDDDAYQQGVAAQRPFYLDHVADLADRAFEEYAALTGRLYARAAGYRVDDALYVVVAQGSVVADCEALCDHLRATRDLKVGVVNVTMFRPFPADLLARLLRGTEGVLVLERVDQPLAADPPLLRELRATMGKAVENGRASGAVPHAGVPALRADEVPDFYAGCFGLGGRDVRPADLAAAVENMLPRAARQRHFYLGIDFVRAGTRLPKLQIWQERLLDSYPQLTTLALAPAAPLALLPPGTVGFRIDARDAREAAALGTALTTTVAALLGLHVKATPRLASFHAALAPEAVKTNAVPEGTEVVLALDPGALAAGAALAGLAEGGVVVVQTPHIPDAARPAIRRRKLRAFFVDAPRIAHEEGVSPATAFLGAFVRVAPYLGALEATTVFDALAAKLDANVRDAALRAMRRGHAEVVALSPAGHEGPAAPVSDRPELLQRKDLAAGPANPGRFWEQVGYAYATGGDGIADPFVALGAVPAMTGAMHDVTARRLEVPEFEAARCTGCGACWVQCPEAAIPGVVTPVEDLLHAALSVAAEGGRPVDRLRPLVKHVASEARRLMADTPFTTFGDVLTAAYDHVLDKLAVDAGRRVAADAEFAPVHDAIADFPLTKVAPFFEAGGLLSVTVNPEACTGCTVCVDACADGALTRVPQTDAAVVRLRANWRLWQALPETDDRYVELATKAPRIGALPALLLKKAAYRSVAGGDTAGADAGEKTAMHLVLAAVHASVLPRVAAFVARVDALIVALDEKARGLLASDADLARVRSEEPNTIRLELDAGKRAHVEAIAAMLTDLRDLRWRYVEGPGGRGRAVCSVVNAAEAAGVPGATYPFNPYPVPWVTEGVPETPAVALGVFEGQMRKMAAGFAAVRRAELECAGDDDPDTHGDALRRLDWRGFTDEELALCPPVLTVGRDAAMADGARQGLSRLLDAGQPIRVVVLDTGTTPRELGLLAIAHRNVFVLQSSPAAPAHLVAGLLRGLRARCPAVFVLNTAPPRAARLALESRAAPLFVHDPAAGSRLGERLSLEGNPALDQPAASVSVAAWAAGEARFRAEFAPLDAGDDATVVPFDEYMTLGAEAREGKTPFVTVMGRDGQPLRLRVSEAIVRLAEDRREVWTLLRDLAGLKPPDTIALEAEFTRKMDALRAEHDAKLADLRARYPRVIARQLAERILSNNGNIADLVARAPAMKADAGHGAAAAAPAPAAATLVVEAAPGAAAPSGATDEPLSMDPWIDAALCTACNECTSLNKRMFAYNDRKQAYIKDPRAGTFKQLVQAAEKCPVRIIHPGSPLDPAEKDLDKWIARAKPFN